ncbi:hypothetical protein Pcinc_002020 [Petrolisthes cinctipes]|uniref:Uncharacterized protein n=1 Tax=Petrolisthes cinctipes TaxID=88211 RepID=A0AAE1GLS4_PETCI|nr:hypothetical protein Pcinc_002020 [Petrolisthes cinctipes]
MITTTCPCVWNLLCIISWARPHTFLGYSVGVRYGEGWVKEEGQGLGLGTTGFNVVARGVRIRGLGRDGTEWDGGRRRGIDRVKMRGLRRDGTEWDGGRRGIDRMKMRGLGRDGEGEGIDRVKMRGLRRDGIGWGRRGIDRVKMRGLRMGWDGMGEGEGIDRVKMSGLVKDGMGGDWEEKDRAGQDRMIRVWTTTATTVRDRNERDRKARKD